MIMKLVTVQFVLLLVIREVNDSDTPAFPKMPPRMKTYSRVVRTLNLLRVYGIRAVVSLISFST